MDARRSAIVELGASVCARPDAMEVVRSVALDGGAGKSAGPALDVREWVVLSLRLTLLAAQVAAEPYRPDAVQFAARSFVDAAPPAAAELLVSPRWELAAAGQLAESPPVRRVYSHAL
jgi:hypothetical protein